jgi:hypothetical protein
MHVEKTTVALAKKMGEKKGRKKKRSTVTFETLSFSFFLSFLSFLQLELYG